MIAAIFDTETTGFSALSNDIIEIAIIIAEKQGDEWVEIANYESLIQHGKEIDEAGGAFAVNGITTKMLVGQPTFAEYMEDLLPRLPPIDIVVGHSLAFDTEFLFQNFRANTMLNKYPFARAKQYCTMKNSMSVIDMKQKDGKVKPPKLSEAYEFFMKEPYIPVHRAMADTIATFNVFKKLEQLQ